MNDRGNDPAAFRKIGVVRSAAFSLAFHGLVLAALLLLFRHPAVRPRPLSVPLMTLVNPPPQPEPPVRAVARRPTAVQQAPVLPQPQQPVVENVPAEEITEVPAQQPAPEAPVIATGSGAAGTGTAGAPTRIGGAAELDNTDFSPVVNIKPAYPAVALKANIEGYVDVDLVVGETGAVDSFSIVRVTGHPSFGDETAKVVTRWRFPPPRIRGKKARIQYLYRVNFTLD